jgi:hypothetical protein
MHTERQTDMMKLTVAFHNFVNTSKNLENLGPVSFHPQVRSALLSTNFFKIHNCRWRYMEPVYIRSHMSVEKCVKWVELNLCPPSSSSSSSISTTTLSWVSACSTFVEHSQQEGFTECRCQRHVQPPNLEENQGYRAFQLSPQEAPSV